MTELDDLRERATLLEKEWGERLTALRGERDEAREELLIMSKELVALRSGDAVVELRTERDVLRAEIASMKAVNEKTASTLMDLKEKIKQGFDSQRFVIQTLQNDLRAVKAERNALKARSNS